VFRACFTGILDLPVPTIAAVHGFALGGGLELALSCDLIVCDDTAVLGLPEVTVGVIPGGGGTQLLSRRIGSSRAADLVFTGRRLDVGEADRLGLVDRRELAGEDRTAALDLARTIAANSPVGVRNAKRALRRGSDVDLATGLDVEDGAWRATAFSGDRAEGVAAFNEKRRPDWPGK
jgi:enoyl-CoA hydratase/carnithine racemase